MRKKIQLVFPVVAGATRLLSGVRRSTLSTTIVEVCDV